MFCRETSRSASRRNCIVSMVAGASISMALFVALRLFLVRDGFSLAWFFHSCCGDEEMYSRLLAAAQSSLTCLEELLWKSGPIISFLFPAYGPLVSALIFACSNLTPQILSFARPVLSDSFGQAGGFEPDTAETTIEQGVADAVAFGCHFVANPDLPQRIRDMPALVAHFVEFLDWRVGRRIDHIPEKQCWTSARRTGPATFVNCRIRLSVPRSYLKIVCVQIRC
jgi:hypothetical protein